MDKEVAVSKACEGASGHTGSWRIKKPVMDRGRCTKCSLCWLYCPDAVIVRTKEGNLSINYDYCKGCGICAEVCPAKAIKMVMED